MWMIHCGYQYSLYDVPQWITRWLPPPRLLQMKPVHGFMVGDKPGEDNVVTDGEPWTHYDPSPSTSTSFIFPPLRYGLFTPGLQR